MGVEAPQFSPAAALGRVGELAIAGGALGAVYLVSGLGITCIFARNGIWCPFCGGTRMVAAGLRGDLPAAFHFNPMLFLTSIVLAVVCVAWVIEWRGGPRLRLPARWGPYTQRRLYIAGGVVSVLFMVGRNLARLL